MKVLIRADANVAIGTGHVMRCLALAQAVQDAGGTATFASAELPQAVRERLERENLTIDHIENQAGAIADAQATASLAKSVTADWVVMDGYQFGAEYQKELKNAGLKVLVVDDNGHAHSYTADLILNQNAHAEEGLYADRSSSTQLLLGPRYAMLRREFRACRGWQRSIPAVARKVLVTFGGSDPENVSLRVIDALALISSDNLEATVIAGGGNPHTPSLEEASQNSGKNIRVLSNVDNMPEWMKWADVAVSASGSTCWEMCFLGLPAVLIDIAANQRPIACELSRRGVAIHLVSGDRLSPQQIANTLNPLLSSQPQREQMSKASCELVDGRGSERVLSAMKHGRLRLRQVRPEDCRLLWEWVNDPAVRAASFSQAPVPWEQHQKWFGGKIADRKCSIYIAEDGDGAAVGQFRVDWRCDEEGEIDVSVAKHYRGIGEGSTLIDLGVRELFATTRANLLHAFIKPSNTASMRAFERAQFKSLGDETVKGYPAVHYVRSRDQKESRSRA